MTKNVYLSCKTQYLEPGDYIQQLVFCCYISTHPELHQLILFTHEVQFSCDGVNNMYNSHSC